MQAPVCAIWRWKILEGKRIENQNVKKSALNLLQSLISQPLRLTTSTNRWQLNWHCYSRVNLLPTLFCRWGVSTVLVCWLSVCLSVCLSTWENGFAEHNAIRHTSTKSNEKQLHHDGVSHQPLRDLLGRFFSSKEASFIPSCPVEHQPPHVCCLLLLFSLVLFFYFQKTTPWLVHLVISVPFS